jgi:hypothetical protein
LPPVPGGGSSESSEHAGSAATIVVVAKPRTSAPRQPKAIFSPFICLLPHCQAAGNPASDGEINSKLQASSRKHQKAARNAGSDPA